MTWTTVSCTVCADAPGYVTVMAMEGGAMLGYCATGSFRIASIPARVMMMAMTHAKTGRSMKNLDMAPSALGFGRRRDVNRRGFTSIDRCDLIARVYFLHPRDDHPVSRLETCDHQPLVANHPIGLQRALLHLVASPHDQGHRLAALIV